MVNAEEIRARVQAADQARIATRADRAAAVAELHSRRQAALAELHRIDTDLTAGIRAVGRLRRRVPRRTGRQNSQIPDVGHGAVTQNATAHRDNTLHPDRTSRVAAEPTGTTAMFSPPHQGRPQQTVDRGGCSPRDLDGRQVTGE